MHKERIPFYVFVFLSTFLLTTSIIVGQSYNSINGNQLTGYQLSLPPGSGIGTPPTVPPPQLQVSEFTRSDSYRNAGLSPSTAVDLAASGRNGVFHYAGEVVGLQAAFDEVLPRVENLETCIFRGFEASGTDYVNPETTTCQTGYTSVAFTGSLTMGATNDPNGHLYFCCKTSY